MANYYLKIKFFFLDLSVIILLLIYSIVTNKKIFVVSNPYGRWGNRLMLFSYIIAWANQHNAIVLNPSFLEYKKYFRNFNAHVIGIKPSKFYRLIILPKILINIFNESFKRISYRKIKIRKIRCFDLEFENQNYESENFKNILHSNRVVFFYGFLFGKRNFDLVNGQRKDLKALFQFSDDITKQSIEILNLVGKPKIVGVCMRQGDYKNHFGGKLYLRDHEYKILIDRIISLLGNDYGVFVACEEMKNNSVHEEAYFNYEDPAVNLCTLSNCDYLVGPASTFMTWAAFLNNIPTCYIDRENFKTKQLLFQETTF